MPEEELRLDVFASYDDDDLERLEDDLENVDDAIAASGKGNREVNIDVDTDAIIAASELEALDEVIESVDDDIEIDVETNAEDAPEELTSIGDFLSGIDSDEAEGFTEPPEKPLDITEDGVKLDVERETKAPELDKQAKRALDITDDGVEINSHKLAESFSEVLNEFEAGNINLDDQITSSRAAGGLAAEGLDDDIEIDVDQSVGTEKVLADMRQTQREIGDDSISLDDLPDLLSRDADDRSGVLKRAKNEFSETLSGAKDGLKDFQFTIAAFNQVLVSVFPALLSFVGAIPAAIVALGGLAGAALTAMAALGAVGVLGLGGIALQGNGELDIQPIMNRLQDIFDTFITAFTPLMETFVAPVKNAFNTIEALADPLAQAASGLTAFQSLFNDTLATVAQGLPSFTAKLVAFGQAAIPILRGFIQFVNNTNFIGFFAEQLQRASGSIFLIIESVKHLVPFIINLSQGFLFVASAILAFISGLAFIFNFFPRLTGVIGAVIGALLLLVTVTTLYSIVTGSNAVAAGLALAGSLLKSAGAAIIAKFGIIGLTLAVVALTSAITLGLAGVISFSGAFDDLTGSIMGANSSLREFNKLTGRSSFSSGFSGPGSPIGQTGGEGSNYDVTVVSGGDKDRAARSAYASSYELKQREQVNSIFGI